ncbi:MAG: TatD family hydrolase [Pirellulales bacterium]
MIDTHAHLAYSQLSDNIEEYLLKAVEAGVQGIVCVGTTAEDSAKCISLAEQHSLVRAAVGIHPNNAHQASAADWDVIQEMSNHPKVVAIGETGLDRYWDDCPWVTQLEWLERQVDLARTRMLPVIIHTRDCIDEAIDWLASQYAKQPFQAVMHSFTGNEAQANRCLSIGFYISFAGMVTFKNAADIQRVAAQIPQDRILVETDSPYLTPHPFRGQRPNHPALVRHTLESIASLRSVDVATMSLVVAENAKRLFSNWNRTVVS